MLNGGVTSLIRSGLVSRSNSLRIVGAGRPIALRRQFHSKGRTLMADSPVFSTSNGFVVVMAGIQSLARVCGLGTIIRRGATTVSHLTVRLRRLRAASRSGRRVVTGSRAALTTVLLTGHMTSVSAAIVLLKRANIKGRIVTQCVFRRDRHTGGDFVGMGYKTVPRGLVRDRLFKCRNNTFANTGGGKGVNLFRLTGGNALFLSRVKRLPGSVRMGLLHILRRRRVLHINNAGPMGVSIHVVTTAGQGLRRVMGSNAFHRSLCCELAIFPVSVPPLQVQGGSVVPLTLSFLRGLGRGCRLGGCFASLSVRLLRRCS